jgi:hypothetical protein
MHCTPHAPQFVWLVARLVSHPFCRLPSQLSKPDAHTGAQCPPEQEVVPLALVHAAPQLPQCVALVAVSVSHPLFGSPSQLANPDEHVGAHTPALQVVVPLALEQAAPHAPQLVFVFSWVSQPLLTLLSQSPKPLAQAIAHFPRVQDGVPLTAPHAVPHVPQLLTFVCRLASQPLPARPSQLPKPPLHDSTLQVPELHEELAFERLHATPQPPQFALVFSCVSQPLVSSLSQLPQPEAQEPISHCPATHAAVAWANAQTFAHVPQFCASFSSPASHPLLKAPSQLP